VNENERLATEKEQHAKAQTLVATSRRLAALSTLERTKRLD
jgi:hypothetical protein